MTELQRLVGRTRLDHAPRGIGEDLAAVAGAATSRGEGAVTVWTTAGEAIAWIPAITEEIDRVTRDWAGKAAVGRAAVEHLEVKMTGGVPEISSPEATWQGNDACPPTLAARARPGRSRALSRPPPAASTGRHGFRLAFHRWALPGLAGT
ncbi:hypothetical protein [Segeticoccus rhizosphaerae]|uniref:hypothetical protein n=1 Tax=Segeticoccus rhizosphaerae TaxID=1104777 RepID=UPI001264B7C7|nr:hypothetical protein [Segeticoccus rhizosphaerae]